MKQHIFLIGAQRSGTSYLYSLLDRHSEIAMAKPLRPEPKYFLTDRISVEGFSGYHRRFFSNAGAAQLLGEKSTTYIETSSVPERLARWFPTAKIVVLLREPVARAISNYNFSVENGLENLDINDAFLKEKERLEYRSFNAISASPFAYLKRGRYIDYLEMYLRYFPREQIFIALTEEFIGNHDEVRRLSDFLDVPIGNHLTIGQVNRSRESGAHLLPPVRALAERYFERSNQELAARFELDLATWERRA